MTPQAAIFELLSRLASRDGLVLVNAQELSLWPKAAVLAMKAQQLIVKARPAVIAVCPGCEQECLMQIQIAVHANGSKASFVVCDKRSDINRVEIPPDQLVQWQCDVQAVCDFISSSLRINRSTSGKANDNLIPIGMFRGKKRSQMLSLRIDSKLDLVADNNSNPLNDLVEFVDGRYAIDKRMILEMVDTAFSGDSHYTPSTTKRESRKIDTQAMYGSWQKEYRSLRKKNTNKSDVWFSQQIARLPIAKGRRAATIKKHMKS